MQKWDSKYKYIQYILYYEHFILSSFFSLPYMRPPQQQSAVWTLTDSKFEQIVDKYENMIYLLMKFVPIKKIDEDMIFLWLRHSFKTTNFNADVQVSSALSGLRLGLGTEFHSEKNSAEQTQNGFCYSAEGSVHSEACGVPWKSQLRSSERNRTERNSTQK